MPGPLQYFASKGHTKIASCLIAMGADVNIVGQNGLAPLSLAAGGCHSQIVSKLIAAGADVDKIDNVGRTPLMHAAFSGDAKTVSLLIEAGADVDKCSQLGWTPLMVGVYRRYDKIVSLLIEAGADVDTSDQDGCTPLMHAACRRDIKTVSSLIEAGADVDKYNQQRGETSLVRAFEGATSIWGDEGLFLLLTLGASLTVLNNQVEAIKRGLFNTEAGVVTKLRCLAAHGVFLTGQSAYEEVGRCDLDLLSKLKKRMYRGPGMSRQDVSRSAGNARALLASVRASGLEGGFVTLARGTE